MSKEATFADDVVEALSRAKILGVRAGTEHRYTGIWVVVIDGRVFVRSWNDKPTGWSARSGSNQAGRFKSANSKFLFEASRSVARVFGMR